MTEVYEFDVLLATHDDLQRGVLCTRRSRVLVSRSEFPTYGAAATAAGCLAVAVHGGMPTSILPRY